MGNSHIDAVSQAHHALMSEIGKLEQAVQHPIELSPPDLLERLLVIRQAVTDHFASEEQGGYFEDVLNRASHLARRLEQLRNDHRRLAASVDVLTDRARNARQVDRELVGQIKKWIDDLRQHESQENLLLDDAYNTDLTAED